MDAERLIPIRRIDPQSGGSILEVVHGDFEQHDGGWIESRVDIFLTRSGEEKHLMQVEFYHEIDTRAKLNPSLFEPGQFGEWHWRAAND